MSLLGLEVSVALVIGGGLLAYTGFREKKKKMKKKIRKKKILQR